MAIHHMSLSQCSARLRHRQSGQFANQITAILYRNLFTCSVEGTFQDLTQGGPLLPWTSLTTKPSPSSEFEAGFQPNASHRHPTLHPGNWNPATFDKRIWKMVPFRTRDSAGEHGFVSVAALGSTMHCDRFEQGLGFLLGAKKLRAIPLPSALQQ